MTTTLAAERFAVARRVADAVLHEGYVLFPYRASAQKNRYRWQFGVVVGEAQEPLGTGEPSQIRSECLVRVGPQTRVEVVARWIHVHRREVQRPVGDGRYEIVDRLEVGDELVTTFDEGVEREVGTGALRAAELAGAPVTIPFAFEAASAVEPLQDAEGTEVGRRVRTFEALDGELLVELVPLPAGGAELAERSGSGAAGVARLCVTVRNATSWSDAAATREEAVRHALVSLHLVLATTDGSFASVIDPPGWAEPHAAGCENRHTHPVLVGEPGSDDVMLCAPIILPDHPAIAPESGGETFDATEMDELLSLCIIGLTDEEKREARATDPRAAELIDRAEGLPPEMLERLHGAIRQFGPSTQSTPPPPPVPRSVDPRGDPRLGPSPPSLHSPGLEAELADFLGVGEKPMASVVVDGGREVRVGASVRLRPRRRSDAQDLFLAGREAVVRRIVRAVDGETYLAVTIPDDPAADLHEWYGRFHYFGPDEVEPMEELR